MPTSLAAALPDRVALVLSGGVALGAYQAGACEVMDRAGLHPNWVVGTSIGAVNGAIVAGNPPGRRAERLRRFWEAASQPGTPWPLSPAGLSHRIQSLASLGQIGLLGCPPIFAPSPATPWSLWPDAEPRPGIFDLAPLRATLMDCVDFGRLNGDEARFTAVAVDLDSGERVLFDTAAGRVEPEHLLASSAFLPGFRPVEVGGAALGDGGLHSNLPVDVVLEDGAAMDLLCLAIDLFARRGARPRSLATAVDRREALLLSSQAHRDLEAHRRLHDMRRTVALLAGSVPADLRGRPEVAAALAEASESAVTVVHMAQRPENEGIGMSLYDFSAAALRRRGEAGAQDMAEALRLIEETAPTLREPGFRIHKIGGDAG